MKRSVVLLALCMLMKTAFAQTQKGYLMLGGNFGGFSYNSKGSSNKSYNFNVTPSLGYLVANRWVVGGIIDLGISGSKSENSQTITTTSYGISPFVRYFLSDADRDKYFAQAKFNVGGLKQTDVSASSYIGYGLSLGYNHFFVKAVALEIGVGYDFKHPSEGFDENNFGVNVGLQIFLPTHRIRPVPADQQ